MSGYTGTQTELLHAFYGAATTSVPTASTAVTITAAQPEIVVPAGFMSALGKRSASLELDIGGYLTTTATPTWSFGVAFTAFASPPVFSAGAPLVTPTTAAVPTTGSGSWGLHLIIGLRTLGVGNASTVWASGTVTSNLFASTPLVFNPGGSGGTTVTNWQNDQEYYLWPYLTLGSGTVTSNTVTTQYAKLYGEN